MPRHQTLTSQIDAHIADPGELPKRFRALLEDVDAVYRTLDEERQGLSGCIAEANSRMSRLESALQAVSEQHPDLVIRVDRDGLITSAASASNRTFGTLSTQSAGARLNELAPELAALASNCPPDSQADFECTLSVTNDGTHAEAAPDVTAVVHVRTLTDAGQVLIVRDAADQDSTHRQIERSNALLRAALESTADGILILDRHGNVTDFNDRFSQFWDLPESVLVTDRVLRMVREQLVRPATFTETLHALLDAEPTTEARGEELERVFETKDGRFFELVAKPQLVAGEVVGSVWSFRNVTRRQQSEKALEFFAYHDQLTNLPNRRMFLDRLEQAIAQSHRLNTKLLVAFVDLDRFKQVNDSLGHRIGDEFLKEVAGRLLQRTRTEDTVARLAGDEFAILINNVNSQRAIPIVAEGIDRVLSEPVELDGHELKINASMGLALYPDDAKTPEDLLARADAAMYAAKANGGSGYRLFQSDMHRESLERLRLENELRAAIEAENLVVHYQPQVSLVDGEITGVEALVRWQRSGTLTYPGEFISIAEESGLIQPIGDWVLNEASTQTRRWSQISRPQFRVAVNISPLQLRNPSFVRNVGLALERSGLNPTNLEIELTESSIMQDPAGAIRMFKDLRTMGVQIAIDDFGTGYSSFSHLKQLPINKLKIDRSFVTHCEDDASNQAILRSLVAMAHNLGLQVIAEGVETKAEAEFLRDCKCDEAQGYFFGRPMSLESLKKRLEHAHPDPAKTP